MKQPSSLNRSRVLLVLPCFNERAGIERLLSEIRALGASYDTVVIDDGSTDNTSEVARRLSPCVRLIRNLGIGGAVQTGIKYALWNDYDFCVQIDGDGQHPPDQVAVLLEAYRIAPANIITGSRYLAPNAFESTWARRIGSRLIALTIRTLFADSSITDPTSGMRLMDRKAIAFFAEAYPHDFPEPISVAWALKHGLTVREQAVKMRGREHGSSSINGFKAVSYMFRVIFYILCSRIQRKPPM